MYHCSDVCGVRSNDITLGLLKGQVATVVLVFCYRKAAGTCQELFVELFAVFASSSLDDFAYVWNFDFSM